MSVPKPRPHQIEALTHLLAGHALHPRMQLTMACGTGKTLVGRWHAQATDAHHVLVLVPSLGLVAQTLAEWRAATGQKSTGWRFRALVVCSDPTTAEGIAERQFDEDGDAIAITAKTWDQVAAKVTTNPGDVARFLNDQSDPGLPRVVFSTYHSSPAIAEAQRSAPDGFDLAICDEAHRVAGAPSSAFSTILDDRKIIARRRLFMTATPKILAVTANGPSMDDPILFGPVAHTISFSEAIEAGLLSDYRVLVATERTDDATYAPAAALIRAVDDYGLRKVLSFHGRVAKAEAFARGINQVDRTPAGRQIIAQHVSGTMRTSARLERLHWLGEHQAPADQTRIVTNARCLSEGVDVPSVDGILFADTRTSVIEIIQAIGRVLRPAPGKTIGTIVLPVAVPEDTDDATVLGLSEFGQIWTVLRALRAHDQRLATDFDQLTRDVERNSWRVDHRGGFRIANVEFTFPDSLQPLDLYLRLADEVGSQWERFYARAETWFAANPGKLMPRSARALDGRQGLGEWAHGQQTLHRRGLLDNERATRLEQLDGWVWDKEIARWWRTHQQLIGYAAEHHTVAEPETGESRFTGIYASTTPRRHLGVWMAEQRQAYRLGTLPAEQSAALEALPGWAWDADLPDGDVAMVEALRVFTEFEKHAKVPDDHLEDGLRLGAWCWAVRRRRWTFNLAPALLDEILAATPSKFRIDERFDWEKNESLWRTSYFALKQYADREGSSVPPNTHKEHLPDTTVGLGAWAALQRFKHRRGELDDRKVQLLEAMPGWTWEVDLRDPAGEPVELPPTSRHGTPGAYSNHGCRCEDCLTWRRTSDLTRLAEKNKPGDPVDAGPVREHLLSLEATVIDTSGDSTRNGRPLIADLAQVALGQVRRIMKGAEVTERAWAERIMEISTDQVLAAMNQTGSRGRATAASNNRLDPGPTFELLDDLNARGFGPHWIGRELGYTSGGLQIRRDRQVSARIAAAVERLHADVGDLVMPPMSPLDRRPTLNQLREREDQPA